MRVQRVDQLVDADGRVIAVQQVEVDGPAEALHAVAQVGLDVRRRDPRAAGLRMRALGHDYDLFPHPGAVAEPAPDQALGLAVL